MNVGGGLRLPDEPGPTSASAADEARELTVRSARKDGRQVASLRCTQRASDFVVECEIHPVSGLGGDPLNPGPYRFAAHDEATAFVNEAMQALTYLGCEVS